MFMADKIDPTVQQYFPTSAKPVFIRLGILLTVLVAIIVWLYIDSHSDTSQKLSEEEQRQVEGIINQPHETEMRLSD